MTKRSNPTKFPVARIKKIMQKDEEVGKVAQATPVVISKALELFLGMLVAESAKVTVERNAKRVEAYHLKHAVECTDMLDFLREIVAGVPDPSAGGTIDLQAESNSRSRARGGGGADSDGAPPARRRRASAPSTAGSTAEKKKRTRKKGGEAVVAPEAGRAGTIAENEEMNYDGDGNELGDEGGEEGDDGGEYEYQYPRESRPALGRGHTGATNASEADPEDDDAYSDQGEWD